MSEPQSGFTQWLLQMTAHPEVISAFRSWCRHLVHNVRRRARRRRTSPRTPFRDHNGASPGCGHSLTCRTDRYLAPP